ncbi:hypothetical protein KR059_007397 [Drosophila kikkawai]|nr:hypothetical protein KR059_007397 [Drosophila kikkawai]
MQTQSLKKLGLALTLLLLLLAISEVQAKKWRKYHKIHMRRHKGHSVLGTLKLNNTRVQGNVNNLMITESQATTTASTATTALPTANLSNFYNNVYTVVLEFGSSGQPLTVLLDTGSANLAVTSSQCQTQLCLQRSSYNSAKSKTYKQNGTSIQIDYVDGTLKGFVSRDTVELDGLKVKNQDFAEVTSLPAAFSRLNGIDGILGMGFIDIAIDGAVPLFYNLLSQNLIDTPVFSVYLNRNASDPNNGGQLLLGGSDPILYKGCITYVPISNTGYWQIPVARFSLGTTTLFTKFEAIVDIGTSLICVPSNAIGTINQKLEIEALDAKDGVYIVPCSKVSSLSDITVNIGRKDFTLKPSDYILNYNGTCISAFTNCNGLQGLSNLWVFGDAFIAPFYLEFDFEYKRIGIAPKL